MDLMLLFPGLILGILFFIMINRRYKLIKIKPIKLKKPRINVGQIETFILNLAFIGFFLMVFVGIQGFDWRIACIICGIAGLWFFFPRGEGR